ncbi:MAG: peptidase S41 [Marinilabiliales bacterium]|nr:MAG: peptidase S41 [Marinilabiliales bacterium]
MKKAVLSLFVSLSSILLLAQHAEFDFNFEKTEAGETLPSQSVFWGSNYRAEIQTDLTYEGNQSLHLFKGDEASNSDFGALVFAIPVTFAGDKIQTNAVIKCKDVDKNGYASVFMRIDGPEGVISLSNHKSIGFTGSLDWKKNSTLNTSLPEQATMVYVGVILKGGGELWADEIELLVDGKSYLLADPKKVKLYPADKDTAFTDGSEIDIEDPTDVQVKNLALLGRVWGFLKYYHPAIAEGQYNWDYELFRFMPGYLAAPDIETRNALLCAWVDSLGELSGKSKLPKMNKNTRLLPDLSWIKDKDLLGEELSLKLQAVQLAKRPNDHYYFTLKNGVGNPVFLHENPYPWIDLPDDGFRLLTLFRYWNAIQYFYPYPYLIEGKWSDALEEFIPEFLAVGDEVSYSLLVLKLVSKINDTHGYLESDAVENYFGRNFSAYKLSFIEGRPVVTGYLNEKLGMEDGLEPGDIIIDVNGENVRDMINRLAPYVPASNHDAKLRKIANLLLRSNNRGVNVTFERQGITKSVSVSCHSPSAFANESTTSSQPAWRFLSDNIGYVYLGSLQARDVPNVMRDFRATQGIIIDIRCYPSAFTVFTLSQYFNKKPAEFAKFTNNTKSNPGWFTYTKPVKTGKIKPPYPGIICILVNEQTQSSAEYHAMAFRAAPHAVVVGSTTAGADGNVSKIVLPGNMVTQFTGIGVYYPDGGETQGVGIVPDYEVRPTLYGYLNGFDEVLIKAGKIIEGRE